MSQLQEETVSETSNQQLPICAKLVTSAQRELAAFLTAVVSLFGSEQTSLAADAWIAELMSLDSVMGFGSRDWRAVTVGALSRLAHHLVNLRKRRASSMLPSEIDPGNADEVGGFPTQYLSANDTHGTSSLGTNSASAR